MFRKALDVHADAIGTGRTSDQSIYRLNESGLELTLDTASVPSKSHTKDGLRSAPSSTANGYVSKTSSPVRGLKRSADSLVKAIGGSSQQSFDNRSTSIEIQNNPTIMEIGSASKENLETIIINEDDFDSDIELEVVQPSKTSVVYPTLLSSGSKLQSSPPLISWPNKVEPSLITTKVQQKTFRDPSTSTLVDTKPAYPSLRKAGLHTHTTPERPFNSQNINESDNISSSVPLPWSSSPVEHFNTPACQGVSKSYLSEGEISARSQISSGIVGLDSSKRPSETNERPPKRRILPWLDADTGMRRQGINEARPDIPQVMEDKTNFQQKALSLDSPPASVLPWNTSASALKQQQKEHKKAFKKHGKLDFNKPNDKSLSSATVSKPKSVSLVLLSKEQRNVLDLVVDNGRSVFFTGSAGTGKSVLLREIIAVLRRKFQKEMDRVAITASTGLAACNIGGVTLHSFAGIGIGKQEVPELIKKIKRNQKAKHRWMRTKVLVIDEISMVDGDLFDKLEEVARIIRGNARPFGGIQLVITGDFFQLPPVPDQGSGRNAKFSFDAKSWSAAIEHTIGLHHVFRQKDPVFAGMLNEMREGRLSQRSIDTFKGLARPVHFEDSMSATELFPTRAEVDSANNSRMRQLAGSTQIFHALDGGAIEDKAVRDKLLSNCMAPQTLELKKGSQVMLIKNMDEFLVNGSLGKVIGFMNEELFDSYNADQHDYMVAQSSEDHESLTPAQLKLRKQMDVAKYSTAPSWPMVRFTNADGTTRDLLCTRESWTIELPNGEVQASRKQIPLILAWALSIHKAQGQTLERVKVDLGKVFEKGQAYVALSRATTMSGLQVLRFDPRKVVAHERVRTFYASLSRLENNESKTSSTRADDEHDDYM